jgi:aspartyl-tRNA(Asn)/glutamyl-tRNA(Gln) amidotransferase subunit A
MTTDALCWLPASELAGLIRRKQVSPVEVVRATLDRVARVNPKLNAFVTVTADEAMREARAAPSRDAPPRSGRFTAYRSG